MPYLLRSRIVTTRFLAISGVSILSGCWHHRRDVVYVDRGRVSTTITATTTTTTTTAIATTIARSRERTSPRHAAGGLQ